MVGMLVIIALLIAGTGEAAGVRDDGRLGVSSVAPSAMTAGVPAFVTVAVEIRDLGVIPESVVAWQVDEKGRLRWFLGRLNDKGQKGDSIKGDGLFAGRVRLSLRRPGVIRVVVSAVFRNPIAFAVSDPAVVEVSPVGVPTDVVQSDLINTIVDAVTGQIVICDEIVLAVIEGTTFAEVEGLARSVGARVAGRIPELGVWQLRLQCGDDSSVLNAALAGLRGSAIVLSAELNPVTAVSAFDVNDPLLADQWGLVAIGVGGAWDVTKGRPLGIGVLDTGVKYDHQDLVGKVALGRDFVDGDGDPDDDHGHGSAVAGIAAAATDNGLGVAGVCPGCIVIAEKVCDARGNCDALHVAFGVVDAVQRGARVINASLGYDAGADVLRRAIEYAARRGVAVVAAAGNANCAAPQYPAAFPGVIAVGAIDIGLQRSVWRDGQSQCVEGTASNFGSWVDVYAPGGDELPKDLLGDVITTAVDGGYEPFLGTSAAAPFVAGTVGLMLSINPDLTPGQIERILGMTALLGGVDPEGKRLRVLNASAAVKLAQRCITDPQCAVEEDGFLRFVEGDPGAPGDGVLVNGGGGFDLLDPFPLSGLTDGFTLTVYPPGGIAVVKIDMHVTNGQTMGSCVVDEFLFAGAPTGHEGGTTTFNGVQGYFRNVTQGFLDELISNLNGSHPGCSISLSDLMIAAIFPVDATPHLIPTLDAAAILSGQNAVPGGVFEVAP